MSADDWDTIAEALRKVKPVAGDLAGVVAWRKCVHAMGDLFEEFYDGEIDPAGFYRECGLETYSTHSR